MDTTKIPKVTTCKTGLHTAKKMLEWKQRGEVRSSHLAHGPTLAVTKVNRIPENSIFWTCSLFYTSLWVTATA